MIDWLTSMSEGTGFLNTTLEAMFRRRCRWRGRGTRCMVKEDRRRCYVVRGDERRGARSDASEPFQEQFMQQQQQQEKQHSEKMRSNEATPSVKIKPVVRNSTSTATPNTQHTTTTTAHSTQQKLLHLASCISLSPAGAAAVCYSIRCTAGDKEAETTSGFFTRNSRGSKLPT